MEALWSVVCHWPWGFRHFWGVIIGSRNGFIIGRGICGTIMVGLVEVGCYEDSIGD